MGLEDFLANFEDQDLSSKDITINVEINDKPQQKPKYANNLTADLVKKLTSIESMQEQDQDEIMKDFEEKVEEQQNENKPEQIEQNQIEEIAEIELPDELPSQESQIDYNSIQQKIYEKVEQNEVQEENTKNIHFNLNKQPQKENLPTSIPTENIPDLIETIENVKSIENWAQQNSTPPQHQPEKQTDEWGDIDFIRTVEETARKVRSNRTLEQDNNVVESKNIPIQQETIQKAEQKIEVKNETIVQEEIKPKPKPKPEKPKKLTAEEKKKIELEKERERLLKAFEESGTAPENKKLWTEAVNEARRSRKNTEYFRLIREGKFAIDEHGQVMILPKYQDVRGMSSKDILNTEWKIR